MTAVGIPHVNIIGHPTGRTVGHPPVDADRDLLTGTALVINSVPDRLDLDDTLGRPPNAPGCASRSPPTHTSCPTSQSGHRARSSLLQAASAASSSTPRPAPNPRVWTTFSRQSVVSVSSGNRSAAAM